MSEPVPNESPSLLGRVDEVCRRFEAAWRAHLADRSGAPRPRPEDYAESLPEADRPLLERELRAVDTAYAQRLEGETLPPDPRPAGEGGSGDAEPVRVRYFGDYELLEKIASGGFGVVYKARQVSLNRLVALKMIADGRLATPELVQRFRLEAEAAAGLEHEGIVPVYEVSAHDGQHYFSMKLIEGGSLTAYVERYVKDPRAAAALVAAVARAVHHAHQRGVLHRDLKPGNILLDAKGQPHVTDFGLAKLLEAGRRTATEGRPETVSGAVLGTPGYMAPEQARGLKGVTTAADVYGLGAVLYELLTGRPPFRADTPLDALVQVLEREPARPRSLDPRVDRDLETVCLKCLEKEPARRYGTAEAVAEELERWLDGRAIQARPAGQAERLWRWCRRNPLVAGLSAGVVLSLMAGIVTSTLFAFRAESQAELARKRESETAAERDRAQEVLADGLLRPLGTDPVTMADWARTDPIVNVFEWQAMADLASLPSEQSRVRPLFVKLALANERRAAQLDRRLRPALQAAVGTNPEARRAVIDATEAVVRDESRPLVVRVVAARVLIELHGEASGLRGPMMGILVRAYRTNIEGGILSHESLDALRQLLGRSPAETVAAVARPVLEIVPNADADELDWLSEALGAVVEYGDPDATQLAAAAVARRVLELAPKANEFQLQKLSRLVAVVAEKDAPEATYSAATAIARRALELAPETSWDGLENLAAAVAAAGRGDLKTTRSAATAILRYTLEAAPKIPHASWLRHLSSAVAAVAGKGDPEAVRAAATAVARRALELVPKADADNLNDLSRQVAAVAGRGDPEATRAAATAVSRRVLELLPKTDDKNKMDDLSAAVAKVGEKGNADAARAAVAAIAWRALDLSKLFRQQEKLLTAMSGRQDREAVTLITRQLLELVPKADSYQLQEVSMWVAALAEKGDPEAARAVATAVARRALELLHEDSSVNALVFALHITRDRVERTPQPEAAAQLGRLLLLGGGSDSREKATAVFDGLLRGASVESLVGLLKHPACVGLMREAVLRELGRQHERSFRSVWDAVAWLQQHRPDIDLNSPPRLARDPPPGR